MLWRLVCFTSLAGVSGAQQCTEEQVTGSSLVQRPKISDYKINVDFGGSEIENDAPEAAANSTAPAHKKVSRAIRPTLVTTEHYNSKLGAWQACASDANKKSDCFQGIGLHRTGDEAILGSIGPNSDISKIAMELHVNCDGTEHSVFNFLVKRMTNAIVELWFNLQKTHEWTADKVSGQDIRVEIPIAPDKTNTARVVVKAADPRKATHTAIDLNAYMVSHSFLECMEGKAETDDCLEQIDASSAEAKLLRSDQALQKGCLEGTSSNSFCDSWKSCLSDSKQAHLLKVLKATVLTSQSLLASEGSDAEDHDDCISPASVDPESWDCDCADSANAACDDMNMERDDQCYQLLLCQDERVCASWKAGTGCSTSQSTALLALQRRTQQRGNHLERALDDSTRSKGCGDRR